MWKVRVRPIKFSNIKHKWDEVSKKYIYNLEWLLENRLAFQIDNQLLSANKWQLLSCQAEPWDDDMNPLAGLSPAELPAGVSATQRPALKIEFDVTPRNYYYSFDVSFFFFFKF